MHAAILTVAKKLSNEFNLILSFSPLSSQHLPEHWDYGTAYMLVSNKLFGNFNHIDVSLYVGILNSKRSYFTYIFSLDKSMVGDPSQLHQFVSINAVTPQKAPKPQWQESSPLGSGTSQVTQGSKDETHTKGPESLIFIKIIIQASCSFKGRKYTRQVSATSIKY